MKPVIIDANPEDKCSLCGRSHRKLVLVDGYKLGCNCVNDYRMYKDRGADSGVWIGWENRLVRVKKMVG